MIDIIKDYDSQPAFADFLPGIAGENGIPAWCFFVNRGQGVASFGTQDKDHPIMEFRPAHTAWQDVQTKGFRTFLKYHGATVGTITLIYEDESGEEFSQEVQFDTNVNRPVVQLPQTDTAAEEEEKATNQWWISVVILGGVILAAGIGFILIKKKSKKNGGAYL